MDSTSPTLIGVLLMGRTLTDEDPTSAPILEEMAFFQKYLVPWNTMPDTKLDLDTVMRRRKPYSEPGWDRLYSTMTMAPGKDDCYITQLIVECDDMDPTLRESLGELFLYLVVPKSCDRPPIIVASRYDVEVNEEC